MEIGGSGLWREVRRVAQTGSTNADLARAADEGEAAGLVLVAERQTDGRGRQGRTWTAPPGSGLTFSVLLRPAVPVTRLGWLPLLTGLAVAEAIVEVARVPARLKWPNDVIVGDRKLAGVLAEVRPALPGPAASRPAAVIVGVGLNVALAEADLPVPTATSLLALGAATTDRAEVLDAVLEVFEARLADWEAHDGDPDASGLRAAYTVRCATVGREVEVQLPRGVLRGNAVGIDGDGCLRVSELSGGTAHAVAAGDVVHVR